MNLDKRQKIILVCIIAAVVILVWQLYSIFGGSDTSPPPSSGPATTVQHPVPSGPVTVNLVPKKSPAESDTMTENQRKYLALVNEYQLVKLQRMIAEDQAAIAAARAATAASLEKLGQGASSDLNIGAGGQNSTGDYELIYTGQDAGGWTATLKKNGQFNDVSAGSVLPDDTKVLSVDDNSVLIQQGDVKKLVTFNGITLVKGESDYTKMQPQLQSPVKIAVKKLQPTEVKSEETSLKTQVTQTKVPKPQVETAAIPPASVLSDQKPVIKTEVKKTKEVSEIKEVKPQSVNTALPSTSATTQKSIVKTEKKETKEIKPQTAAVVSPPVSAAQKSTVKTEKKETKTLSTEEVKAVKKPQVQPESTVIKAQPVETIKLQKMPVPEIPSSIASPVKSASSQTSQIGLPTPPSTLPLPQVVKTSQVKSGLDITKANKNGYTIQLIAGDNRKAVIQYVEENHLTGKAQVIKTGSNKYIAVIGEYADTTATQKAIGQLPENIRSKGPFVKSIRDIQAKVSP